MTLHDVTLRLRALIRRRRAERELDEELAFHLERETQKYVANGMGLNEARTRARARFGSAALAADECRDARGTAFVDDCMRDVRYAFRTFRRAPLAALTIVTTIALGLGLVAVVFTFFNRFVFRVDNVRNPEELFAVVRLTRTDQRVHFTYPQYEALRRETTVFSDVVATLPDIDSRIDGRMMGGTLVTGNFFQVLGVDAALGRALTPADDDRTAPRPVMVLSHRGWSRLFPNDRNVIGRSVIVNGAPYAIVGVMPDGFRGLAVSAPDYWAPLSLLGAFRPIHAGREDAIAINIVGRLKPGMTRATALAGLVVWDSRLRQGYGGQAGEATADVRSSSMTLEPRQGTIPKPMELLLVLTPLFFVFGLILMIGCANVANLLLARAVARQREIGVRLAIGASRRRIVRQLLTESLLLAAAAAALGFVVSRVAIDAAIYAVTITMAPEIAENVNIGAPASDWRVIVFLIVGAVASTVFFGLAPALQATRVQPVKAVRGEVTEDARPSRARNVLIGAQVTASALLLVCAAIFLRSSLAASSFEPGIRTSDTVIVEIINEPLRDAMVQAVVADPLVEDVAASWPDPLSVPRAGLVQPASAGTSAARSNAAFKLVSPEYFRVLGIDVLKGRGFTQAEREPNAGVVVVSETLARELWRNGNAVGQILHLDADPHSETRSADEPLLPLRSFTVVGVVRDVAGARIPGFKAVDVYVPVNTADPETSLVVRVHGDPEIARRALLQRLTSIDPNMGQVMTLRTMARMATYLLQIAFWLTVVLGGLALALTLSGLFSVLSYVVEQRKREIGVRMALGATVRDVAGMVLLQAVRPVSAGIATGAGLAAALAVVLMSTPAAATIGSIVHVFDPVAYGGSILCIVAACALASLVPTIRAARIDAMTALRQD